MQKVDQNCDACACDLQSWLKEYAKNHVGIERHHLNDAVKRLNELEEVLKQIHEDAKQIVLRDGHELPLEIYVLTRRIFVKAGKGMPPHQTDLTYICALGCGRKYTEVEAMYLQCEAKHRQRDECFCGGSIKKIEN